MSLRADVTSWPDSNFCSRTLNFLSSECRAPLISSSYNYSAFTETRLRSYWHLVNMAQLILEGTSPFLLLKLCISCSLINCGELSGIFSVFRTGALSFAAWGFASFYGLLFFGFFGVWNLVSICFLFSWIFCLTSFSLSASCLDVALSPSMTTSGFSYTDNAFLSSCSFWRFSISTEVRSFIPGGRSLLIASACRTVASRNCFLLDAGAFGFVLGNYDYARWWVFSLFKKLANF